MKRIFLLILLISIILTGCSSNNGLIKETVNNFLEARWQLLLDYNIPLEEYYDLTLESALPEIKKDKAIIKKHIIDPRSKEGVIIHNVKIVTRIDSIDIDGNLAKVRATVEKIEIDEQIGEDKYTSTLGSIEHDINLIKKNDKWLISNHKSYDMYSQIYD